MRRLLFLSFWISLLYAGGTNSGTVLLYNDSPFILTATILAADGTYLGSFSVQPGEQKNITQNLFTTEYTHPGFPQVSYTPFTIIWQCPSESYYGVCTNIATGAMVRATDCGGAHFCSPKKKKEPPSSTIETKK